MHDLIMREPLFEIEYKESFENRYRFAWTVATKTPIIRADDVDQDLVFKAKRAVDKNWRRRALLQTEDFMADSYVQEQHALSLLGLGSRNDVSQTSDSYTYRLRRILEVARFLSIEVSRQLRENRGITATHSLDPGQEDSSKILVFRWQGPDSGPESRDVTLELNIAIEKKDSIRFGMIATLSTKIGSATRQAKIEFPPVVDSNETESELLTQVNLGLPSLAVRLTGASGK